MKNSIQLSIFGILSVVTLLACRLFPNASTDPEAGLIMWLPSEVGVLKGKRISVSSEEASTLPPDTEYLKMAYNREESFGYQPRFWDGLSATLILSGTDRRSLHEPEICLDAQGWEIVRRVPVTVETSVGPLEVMNLELGRWQIDKGKHVLNSEGNRIRIRAHYIYWWVSKKGSTAFSDKRVMQTVVDNFLRNKNYRWGYPSVFVYADPTQPEEESFEVARKRGLDFVGNYAPRFQKSLGAKIGGEVQNMGRTAEY